MTTIFAVSGFAALFVVFGVFRLAGRGGCGDCSCTDGTCHREGDDGATGPTLL
jgi:hypothetical protein